jgi:hypothetical protein
VSPMCGESYISHSNTIVFVVKVFLLLESPLFLSVVIMMTMSWQSRQSQREQTTGDRIAITGDGVSTGSHWNLTRDTGIFY